MYDLSVKTKSSTFSVSLTSVVLKWEPVKVFQEVSPCSLPLLANFGGNTKKVASLHISCLKFAPLLNTKPMWESLTSNMMYVKILYGRISQKSKLPWQYVSGRYPLCSSLCTPRSLTSLKGVCGILVENHGPGWSKEDAELSSLKCFYFLSLYFRPTNNQFQ